MSKNNTQTVNIIDVTVKEGGFRTNHHILTEQVENIVRGLDEAGVEYAEVCHGKGIGGKKIGYPGLHSDRELLEAARKGGSNIKLSVYLATYPFSLEEIEETQEFFDMGRIGVNVHEPEKAFDFIKKLKKHNKTVVGQLLRVHAKDLETSVETAKKLASEGADILYLTDSFSSLRSEDVRNYVGAIKSAVKIPLGFQGRNGLGFAMANTLAAIEAGATWLDASLLGMGQGAGVTNLEVLVSLLQRQGQIPKIKLSDLGIDSKFYVLPCFRSLPYCQRIDLALAKHKLDYYPQQILEIIREILGLPMGNFLTDLKAIRKDLVQLQEKDIRKYLEGENLDYDVVLDYIKSGTIPVFEGAE